MLSKTYILSSLFLLLSYSCNSQTKFDQFGKRRNDSLKSEVYEIYSARLKDGQVQKKGRRSGFYDGYPYRIGKYKKVYLQNGLIAHTDDNNQVEDYYYNELGQPLKRVIKRIKQGDSIVVNYIYDDHDNISVIRSFGSEDIFYQWNRGVIGGPFGEYFTNFYLKTDSVTEHILDSVVLVPNNINRFYNTQNKLIKESILHTRSEKYLYINRNVSMDTTLTKTDYFYNDSNELSLRVKEKTRTRFVDPSISKSPIIDIDKEITYYNEHEIEDSIIKQRNYIIQTKETYSYNSEGTLIKSIHTDLTLQSVKTETFENGNPVRYYAVFKSGREFLIELEYEHDKKGNWVKCIHYINGKPKFWVERTLEYYN